MRPSSPRNRAASGSGTRRTLDWSLFHSLRVPCLAVLVGLTGVADHLASTSEESLHHHIRTRLWRSDVFRRLTVRRARRRRCGSPWAAFSAL
jgi:hypothetical protein